MEIAVGSRLRHAWNAFRNNSSQSYYRDVGIGYSYRPDRPRLTRGNERSIVTSVYNRIALDVAQIKIQHVRLDENDRFLEVMNSCLNNCLSLEVNLDQTGRSFIQDIVMSMFDEGCVAVVPVDTDDDPEDGIPGSFDINTMRTGKILEWYPRHVRVRVYNDQTGQKEDILLPKSAVAIIENPLYAVINEPNSTMQRLIRKLNLLDVVDEQSSSGKLDLIVQLPYVIKTEARRLQAENRRKDIERQLSGSKYGIAYTDGTEHITQLNRSVGNNLMAQIEYLTSMLYSQLGITQSILDGTADEKTMLNYYNRTIEPIVSAIVDEMKRKFLTKTARSQHQSIMFFRDPFKLVPVTELAEISDKLTRNEIATSNEMRQIIGWKPSTDPKADELRNKNLNQSDNGGSTTPGVETGGSDQDQIVNELLDSLEAEIEDIIGNYLSEDGNEEEEMMMGNEYIRHYASPYYDPVKAHEYYMKTRELKGKRSVQKLSDEGKKVWAYAKNEIKTEKKEKVDAEREKQKQTTTDLRERASETRKQISSRLKELNEALTKRAASRKERIESEKKSDLEDVEKNATKRREQMESKTNAEIEKLMAVEIPKSLSKAERAERLAERNEKIAKLRSGLKSDKSKLSEDFQSDKASVRADAQSRKQKVSDETREDKAANSANASAERFQVSAELKSAIAAAREAYKAAKESLDSSYEEIYQREYDKIASEYKKVSKRKSRKKGK